MHQRGVDQQSGTVNRFRQRRFEPILLGLAILALLAAPALAGVQGQTRDDPATPQGEIPPVPRPIYIYAGECGDLREVLWPLNRLISPSGTVGGSDDADRTEYSFTANMPLTIERMLAGDYAINVHESDQNPDHVLTCGNIGGVPDSVGRLVVGLREQGDSGVSGIAVLSPSPSDPAMTFVSVFIAGPGLGDEIGTIGIDQPVGTDPGSGTPAGGDSGQRP
jgi:hypothetical protein